MRSLGTTRGLRGQRRSADLADFREPKRGISIVEVLVAIVILGILAALSVPWILEARGAARRISCRSHLHALTVALRNYHDTYASLPPAAHWSTRGTTSMALQSAKRIDRITHENWLLLLLPFCGEERLAQEFDTSFPIGDSRNAGPRTKQLSLVTCADDSFNRSDNRYQFPPLTTGEPPLEFARGNYAINGGSHSLQIGPPTTTAPKGDLVHLVVDGEARRFELWGNGVAGINRCFALDEFVNGQSTLVAIDEIRAGIHPIDPRGVWSLGQIGGSITWAHGVAGDDYAPNHQWDRSDDVLGCGKLHSLLGSERLMAERMPCVHYVDANSQATARSLHPGGVHVAMLDGSTRFISDAVDPGIWTVMHSRETPADILAEDFDRRLATTNFTDEAAAPAPPSTDSPATHRDVAAADESELVNSIGMKFRKVPDGEFIMGMADEGTGSEPPDSPAHQVRLTHPYWLGAHEVSRGQFSRLMQNPLSEDRSANPPREDNDSSTAENLPVADITWNEAVEFCTRLSSRPEEQSAGRRYRLPTEAEWEYACRGGSDQPYKWNLHRRPDDSSGEAAGILPPLPLTPVGTYPPNRIGLYDMRGNVWEWTADWFDRDYYARSPIDDPRGPSHGYLKVVRGGDWKFIGEACRIEYSLLPPWKSNAMVGFRVVCETATPAGSEN